MLDAATNGVSEVAYEKKKDLWDRFVELRARYGYKRRINAEPNQIERDGAQELVGRENDNEVIVHRRADRGALIKLEFARGDHKDDASAIEAFKANLEHPQKWPSAQCQYREDMRLAEIRAREESWFDEKAAEGKPTAEIIRLARELGFIEPARKVKKRKKTKK